MPVLTGGDIIKKKGRFEQSRASGSGQTTAAKTAAKKTAPKTAAKKKKKSSAGKIAAITAASLVLVAAMGVCAYGLMLKGDDSIYPNVYVAGVNVGGLKRDAAVSAVEEAVEKTFASETLTVTLPDQSVSFDPEITQVALNADDAVDAAMNYGRDGNPFTAVLSYLKSTTGTYAVDLDSNMNLDTQYIYDRIQTLAEDVRTDFIPADISINPAKDKITVVTGSPARYLDADSLYNQVIERYRLGDFTDLPYDYSYEAGTVPDLQPYYDEYCKEVTDAYYDEEKKELVGEETGRGFDLDYYSQQVALAGPGTKIEIPIETLTPEVTLEELQKIYFVDVLGSCDSPHTNIPDRTTNLTLACQTINGMILNPGEEFSFNGAVGERTEDKGYKKAVIYADAGTGKSEPDYGGGVCQVASTIYTACLYADMKVTERSPHVYLVTYVEAGMDATVYWGSLDFKFKNSSEYPVRIDASVSGGYVHIKLVGTQDPDRGYDHIVLSHNTVGKIDYKRVIEEEGKAEDKKTEITIVPGGGVNANGTPIDIAVDGAGNKYIIKSRENYPYTGYVVLAYRSYVDADGKEIKKEELHRDVYQARNESYSVEPYVEPEITKPEEPEPEETDPENPGTDDPGTGPGTDTPPVSDPPADDSGNGDDGAFDWWGSLGGWDG